MYLPPSDPNGTWHLKPPRPIFLTQKNLPPFCPLLCDAAGSWQSKPRGSVRKCFTKILGTTWWADGEGRDGGDRGMDEETIIWGVDTWMDIQVDTLKKNAWHTWMPFYPFCVSTTSAFTSHWYIQTPLFFHSACSIHFQGHLVAPSPSSIPGSPLYCPCVTFARVIILTRCSHIGADASNLSVEHSQGVYWCHFTSKSVDKQVNCVFYLASGLTLAVLWAAANLDMNENLNITIIQ